MFRSVAKWTVLALLFMPVGSVLCGQESLWVFEGLITKADPKLAPDLQSGWVLSGSFLFTGLEMEEEIPVDGNRSGRFSGGIKEGELTVDLYHQLHFEALQVPGLAGFDYKDNDPDENGRDLYGWFIPMKGVLKKSGWSSRWLQIWLSDSKGEMIRSIPPAISPYGLKADVVWFRLTMENEAGEPVYVDGSLDYFGPLSGRDETEEDWRGVAAGLSAQLIDRDRTILDIREELARARSRVDSLRQMVDILVEERRTLQEENRLLTEQADQADPEVDLLVSGMEADKALLEEEMSLLSDRNVALAESLAESEQLRRKLLREMESIEIAAAGTTLEEADEAEEAVIVPVTSLSGEEVGVMKVVEKPMTIERPVQEPASETMEFRPLPVRNPPPPPRKKRLSGPRKYR